MYLDLKTVFKCETFRNMALDTDLDVNCNFCIGIDFLVSCLTLNKQNNVSEVQLFFPLVVLTASSGERA